MPQTRDLRPHHSFVVRKTGVVILCGDNQIHIPPATGTSEMDSPRVPKNERTLPPELGSAGPVDVPPMGYQRILRSYREEYRRTSPQSPRESEKDLDFPSDNLAGIPSDIPSGRSPEKDLDTATRGEFGEEKAKIPPIHGTEGEKNTPIRRGYRDGPPSSQTPSWSQFWSRSRSPPQKDMKGAGTTGKRMRDFGKSL